MTWLIRETAARDAAGIAGLFARSRTVAMPWLPVLHTAEEDVAFFGNEIETSRGWVAMDHGAPVGFAFLRDGWLSHLYVDPDSQGRGIGSALLARVLSAMPYDIQLWAFERNTRARDFYAGRGFIEVERTDGSANQEREPDVRMVRGRPSPERVMVRIASPDDAAGLAQVHTAAWQEGYRGLLPQDFLDLLDWRTRYDWWRAELNAPTNPGRRVLVAAIGGQVVGFIALGPARDDDLADSDPPCFEIYAIYVSPERWSEGIGSALMTAGREAIPEGADSVVLWVLRDNVRARAFYRKHGFDLDGTARVEEIGGSAAHELRFSGFRLAET